MCHRNTQGCWQCVVVTVKHTRVLAVCQRHSGYTQLTRTWRMSTTCTAHLTFSGLFTVTVVTTVCKSKSRTWRMSTTRTAHLTFSGLFTDPLFEDFCQRDIQVCDAVVHGARGGPRVDLCLPEGEGVSIPAPYLPVSHRPQAESGQHFYYHRGHTSFVMKALIVSFVRKGVMIGLKYEYQVIKTKK